MSQVLQFLGDHWRDILTVVGLAFGIVTLIAYLDQRRSAKVQDTWNEFVQRHVAHDISGEQLAALDKQIQAMTDEVKTRIPHMARQAVLREQLQIHASAIAEHYDEWKRLATELESVPAAAALDPEIERAITDRLIPRFERTKETERLRNRVTVISIAAALAATALPSPVDHVLALALAFPLGSALYRFACLTGSKGEIDGLVRGSLTAAYWIGAATALVAGPLMLQADGLTSAGEIAAWVLIVSGSSMAIAGVYTARLSARRARLET